MKKLICLIAVMIGLISCAEHAANNVVTVDGEYLPISKGNYWVFDTWELDIFNNQIESTKAEDSLFVAETGVNLFSQDNTNQAIILKFRNGILIDTIKFKMKDNYVYSNGGFIDSIVINESKDYKFIDKDFPYFWNVSIDTFKFVMNFSGLPMNCKQISLFNAYSENEELITIDGTAFQLMMYEFRKDSKNILKHYFENSKIITYIKIDTIDGVQVITSKDSVYNYDDSCTVNLFYPKKTYIGFIKDVGIAQIVEKPYTVTSTKDRNIDYVKLVNYGVNGRYSILKRYKIIKK